MMPKRTSIPVLVLLLLHGPGCATTTIRTTERLDHGQTVVSAAVEANVFPRVTGQGVVGVGGVGDLGVHAGTSGFSVNGGVSARGYLGPVANLTLQAEGALGMHPWGFFVTTAAGAHVTSVPTEGRGFYLGTGLTHAWGDLQPERGLMTADLVFGYERAISQTVNVQIELIVSPLYMPITNRGMEVRWATDDYFEARAPVQLAVALNQGRHRATRKVWRH